MESGLRAADVTMASRSGGGSTQAGDNAVLVLHALTGDSHVVGPAGPDQPTPGWWDGLIGPGAPLDDRPLLRRRRQRAGRLPGHHRPVVDRAGRSAATAPGFPGSPSGIRSTAEAALADRLGINSFAAVVGGSMGGMRALEWARRCTRTGCDRVHRHRHLRAASPATRSPGPHRNSPPSGPTRISPAATTTTARPPLAGMAVARQIAHTTYRSGFELDTRFGRAVPGGRGSAARRPLRGASPTCSTTAQKLGRRFDPNSYLVLTEAMNSHDIGRGRGGVDAALQRISAELTVAVVDSDRLLPAGRRARDRDRADRPAVDHHALRLRP